MTLWRGTYYNLVFNLNLANGSPVDITGWTFRSQIRDRNSDPEVMIELTTENGGIVIVDALLGKVELRITAEQNRNFSLGNVVGDLFRMDVLPGPERLFGFRDRVRRPVTRDA